MKLKRVEIQGFKSFVDRTVLEFHSGITGIVGPNGCGKSNLVDAIRWVLGENNARTLRGGIMEDVIFNGTDTRPPLGMAEVTLTMSNEDGSAPAQYNAFPEISMTRRVYRDGDSEYLVNKTPCRLKDITDIFMGTGANFYSVVEQGKIASIVSAKPEELRTFIEEAAGITFYKSRKRAALRRIDATEKNLTRVSDILSEITRQIKYLERQARKAERYREYRDQLRNLELNIAHRDLMQLSTEISQLRNEKMAISDRLTGSQSSSEEISSKLEGMQLDLREREEAVQSAQKNLFEAGKSLAEKEHRLEFLEREITELSQRHTNIQTEIEQAKAKLEFTEGRKQKGILELEDLRENNQNHRERLAELENDRATLEEELAHYRDEGSQIHQQVLHKLEQVTRLQQKLQAMDEEDTRSSEEAERWLKERDTLIAERDANMEEKTVGATRLQELSSSRTQLLQQINQLQIDVTATLEQREQLQAERESVKLAHAESKSRLDSLLALVEEEDASQFIHFANAQGDHKLQGSLAELIQVDPRYERAIEGLLGEKLKWVVLKEGTSLQLMRNILAGEGLPPRSTVVPCTPASSFSQLQFRDWSQEPEVIARVADITQCSEEMRALLDYASQGALLVENLEAAERLVARFASDNSLPTIVTLGGETIVPGAETTAGKFQEANLGILKRQREIAELTTKVEDLGQRVVRVETELRSCDERKIDLQSRLSDHQSEAHRLNLQQVDVEKDIDRMSKDVERLVARIETLENEHAQVLQRYEELKSSQEERRQELLLAEREQRELADREQELKSLVEETDDKLSETSELLTQTRVQNASSLEKEENLAQEQIRLADDLESLTTTITRQSGEIKELKEREEKARDDVQSLQVALVNERAVVVELESTFNSSQRSYQEQQSAIQRMEIQRRETDTETNQLTKNLSELEIGVGQQTTKHEHIRNVILERWKVDLEAVTPDPIIEVTEEVEVEAAELKTAMEKMGEVNLGAVEEHEFLKDRCEFLTTQRGDLESSLKRLMQTIRKIDTTTRKLFFEAFEGINKELQVTFPEVFRGGKAELHLTGDEDTDPLERGLTIIARPPGKRPQHITLLSGGEKSLTAAALIFAIFRYKPAPFSILDEVDAALDDENTRRLNSIAQKVSENSQLVVITHNKTTMEISQHLYGITMEEPGVTKIVSVRLEEEKVHPKPTADFAPSAA